MGTVLLWFGAIAVAFFIGYATVPPTTPYWVTMVLWWGFIVSGVLFFLIALAYLARIVRRHLINRQVPDKKQPKELLRVSNPEIYEVGDGSHWLRLKVENPTSFIAKGCYGKLIDRKHVSFPMGRHDEIEHVILSDSGHQSREHGQLPPEGHPFPWSPVDRQLLTTTISAKGNAYLYLVTKHHNMGCFWFPANVGKEWENWGLGNYELQIEVGTESDNFKPNKTAVTFCARGGDLEVATKPLEDSARLDILKSPRPPELQISYQKHEFGIDNGVPVITVWAEYRPTGLDPMRIEAIKIQLVGGSEPSLDWKVYVVKQDIWITSDNKFKVPDGISPGEHDVVLAAYANGEWWGSRPFTIAFPEVNP